MLKRCDFTPNSHEYSTKKATVLVLENERLDLGNKRVNKGSKRRQENVFFFVLKKFSLPQQPDRGDERFGTLRKMTV